MSTPNNAVPAAEAHGLPADAFAVNLMRLAGLDKHKARECEEIVRQVLAANVQPKGSDKANEWRKLAQQFDGQRMAAMAHLRTLLMFPDTHAEAVRAFLAATPAEQIASVQAPAPTQAWNHTTAELSAIYGEMAAINETPAKHQTEAQRERLKVLRAEAVAIGVRRYALAAQPQAPAWQPIETAPRDGTWILARRSHATRAVILRYDAAYDAFENDDGEHVYHLTHWMPLPAAPQTKGAE